MKTGMELPLLGLVVLLALLGLWAAWSDMQVDIASASLNAMVAGTAAPAPALVAGQWVVKALVGALIGGVVTAAVTAGIVWARRQWTAAQQSEGNWRSGPNAQWRRERQPKAPSESELLRMMLMQQMAQSGRSGQTPVVRQMEADDEPILQL